MQRPDALDAYLAAERAEPFEWGRKNRDCILYFAGWHEAATGKRFGDAWRALYTSEAEAKALIAAHGGLPAIFTGYLGQPIRAGEARRGDGGLIAVDGWHVGLICTGRMWSLKHPKRGTQLLRRKPDLVWRVEWAGRA